MATIAARRASVAQQTLSRRTTIRVVQGARPARGGAVVVKAFDLKSAAGAAVLAGALLASPVLANDYTDELEAIIKARGTDLDQKLDKAVGPVTPEAVTAPALEAPVPVTVTVPVEQRKELIRAEAVAESEAAQTAVGSASTNGAAATTRPAAARKNLSASSSAGGGSPSAALGVLGVLGLAGGAAYYLSTQNASADGGATPAPAVTSAPPAAAAPPPPPPAPVADAAAEGKTPTPV